MAYQDELEVQNYLNFLDSENGRIQQDVLFEAIIKRLKVREQGEILDACAGPGWLAGRLAKKYKVSGFDASSRLVDVARKRFPGIEFKVADTAQTLPYSENIFDAAIFNMAALDVDNRPAAFKNLYAIVKPFGQLLLTIPNPYYTYPVAVWKRSVFDILLGRKPRLKFHGNYFNSSQNIAREFKKGESIASHFYKLSDYFSAARDAGFNLVALDEIFSAEDDKKFSLRYQLHRYPLLLLLEFVKPN